MTTTLPRKPTHQLERLALQQAGYFDRRDALDLGLSDELLRYHVTTGAFERVYPGVYRLATAPESAGDDFILAWVWSNYRGVISHESALVAWDLSDVMPNKVWITVPPEFGRKTSTYHLIRSRLTESEVTSRNGFRLTRPARTIVDCAATGTDPEQIHKAIQQAVRRAIMTKEELLEATNRSGYRYKRLVRSLVASGLRLESA